MSTQTTSVGNKKSKLWLRYLALIALLLIIGSALAYKKFQQIQAQIAMGSTAPPPISVTTAPARDALWNQKLKAIGSLVAAQGVDITNEVSGIIIDLNFQSGQKIEEGTRLLSLSSDVEIAALETAKAQYESANSQYQRSRKLKDKQFVTENDLDQQRGVASSARSQVDFAKASLFKKDIHAPFSGKLGIRKVDIGEYLSPGTKIVSLQSVEQLYLDFTLPEQDFSQLEVGLPIEFKVRANPDARFYAKVEAWEPALDPTTRNVRVRAIVDNADNRLAPGMFAELDLESSLSIPVLMIPETAVFYNIYGEAVYVLDESSEASSNKQDGEPQTFVLAAKQIEVLYRKNGQAGIKTGLKSGDQVVTSGQLKLFPSLKVKVVDEVSLSNETAGDARSPDTQVN